MLFGDSGEGHSKLRAVRDVVEIVAIIAAGIWAFYIFIYENRIVPAQATPAAESSATLERTSEHNGLIGIRLISKIHNSGTVPNDYLGFMVAVTGQRVAPSQKRNAMRFYDSFADLATDYQASKQIPVYVQGFITELGNSKGGGLTVQPGADVTNEYVFYVHTGEYDRLNAYIIARFVHLGHAKVPTSFGTGPDGLPRFLPAMHGLDVEQTYAPVAVLDLNSK